MNRFKLEEPLDSIVRKHLLTLTKPLNDDDIEIAIHKGWTARDNEVEQLKAENARYREALENACARSHEVHCDWFNPNDDKCNCILSVIHKALKGE